MKPFPWKCLAVLALVLVAAGCSGGGPRLYKAGGTVKRNNKPVEGAQVTFAYDNGNFANGHTDAEGKFQLTYQNLPGGTVPGKCTVTVSKMGRSATEPTPEVLKAPPKSAEEQKAKMLARQKLMADATKRAAETSPDDFTKTGFTFEITTDETKNNFNIEIKD